ncbi:MAG: hypothetical protein IPJ03_17155 [Ignavibacteriales bacterium]|nr:hypothetical protein [Ignavibacteriales bacterium]
MSVSVRLKCDPQREIAYGDIDVAYMGVGSSLQHPARIIYIYNGTNTILQFSYDGLDDHFVLPTQGLKTLDIASNRSTEMGIFLPAGERLYVKQAAGAPTSGSVYFTVYYSEE